MMQVNFLHESSGVWVLPTRTFAAVYGQRLCLLFSKISYPQSTMLPLFPKQGAFYFHFFRQTPVFLGENVRCKVKRILGDPPNPQNIVRCKVGGVFGSKILLLPYPLICEKNVRCKVEGKIFLSRYQVFARNCPLKYERGYFFECPPNPQKIVRCSLRRRISNG